MLDYNHSKTIGDKINDHIDAVLIGERDAIATAHLSRGLPVGCLL